MNEFILSAALKSGKGLVRTNNEDAYYFNGAFGEIKDMDLETSLQQRTDPGKAALFAVCDGMGGYENGEVASYTAVSRMGQLQQSLAAKSFSEAVMHWVDETNKAILQAANEGGCTLAMLYYQNNAIQIAHIGDSRVYRYHQGALSRVTKDHSKVQVLLDAGLLTAEEAKTYPQRHVITRALGMDEEENGRCTPTIQEPIQAEDADCYLICSDGVTDMLPDEQIQNILARSRTAVESADGIYQAALNAGGKDNTTVIVIKMEQVTVDLDTSSDRETVISPAFSAKETMMPVSIEQVTTFRQPNGERVTIKTEISGSSFIRFVPMG